GFHLRCAIARADDDVLAAEIDDQVQLRGVSHVSLEQTQSLAHELADDDVALEVSDPAHTPL
ncbi:MAG TPA: hypothetical protein VK427_11710, partial [Kofleriaceae bacterium]|nr:hypothetical protein [Kofleriaceae bacterium]